ncbi:MAG: hypothetical protein CENE_01655 [Candidatus Celerinatantimonas neptuna]|nr:MAG: hypothetical protein CENE_01655 [Candidatus Celerinatantimonas neptuna]
MEYLVAISIGPVQSLIEAGRRSQDLWCGSWLLSEVARAVALNLHEAQKDCLIFPCPENPSKDLQPQSAKDEPKANIANVVRAVIKVDTPEQLNKIVEEAKKAADERFSELFKSVEAELNQRPNQKIDWPRWQQQQGDLIEKFAAWAPLSDDYADASRRLGEWLNARKCTRNFGPMADQEKGLFKSTLDGANNTLTNHLTTPRDQHQKKLHKHDLLNEMRYLGLSQDEELDALGLIKRRAGRLDQFTPFSRVVVHPWVMKLKEQSPQILDELKTSYQALKEEGLVTVVAGNQKCYEDFPFDAEYLFLSRVEQALTDGRELSEEAINALESLQKTLQALQKEGSAPVPYGVLLKADGDRMGECFKQAGQSGHSRDISRALHDFAESVRSIVRGCGGHAIYTGGDDVLAFVPLATAMTCAQALNKAFYEQVAQKSDPKLKHKPTLSVGLAIGHFVQPMRQLRHRAIAAEERAKGNKKPADQQRNAIAIHLGIRSGFEMTWRCRWDDRDTLDALSEFANAFEKGWMPTRIMQDVREMAQRLKWTYSGQDQDQQDYAGIRNSEFERMLMRTNFVVNEIDPNEKPEQNDDVNKKIVEALKSKLRSQAKRHSLDALANLLVLARWFSAKTSTDIGGAE